MNTEEIVNKKLMALIKVHYEKERERHGFKDTFEDAIKRGADSFNDYYALIKQAYNLGVQKSHDAIGPEAWFSKQKVLQLKIKE